MSIFDAAYDEMTWREVCCRLPSELALRALQRRVKDLTTMAEFIESVGAQPSRMKEVKELVNNIITNSSVDDVFGKFATDKHPLLFNWLNDSNCKRIKEFGTKYLTTEFLFNLTSADDIDGMQTVLDKCLAESTVSIAKLVSILSKVMPDGFQPLLNKALSDTRPEVRVSVLGIHSAANWKTVSDLQKMIAIKALAKCNPLTTNEDEHGLGPNSMQYLDFKLFAQLKPLERLLAMKKYFSYFPKYHKVKVFDPPPSQEDFDVVLFAGCIEHNELVNDLNKMYKEITEEDEPTPPADPNTTP